MKSFTALYSLHTLPVKTVYDWQVIKVITDTEIFNLQGLSICQSFQSLLTSPVLLQCTWGYKSEELYHISVENPFLKHKEEKLWEGMYTINAVLKNQSEIY